MLSQDSFFLLIITIEWNTVLDKISTTVLKNEKKRQIQL